MLTDSKDVAPHPRSYKMGCKLAGPGRGDCDHFVGSPKTLEYPKDVDEYGIPHGWCDYCWQSEKVDRLADFILTSVPGEPSQNEGAIDTAIRLLRGVYSARSAEVSR